MRKVVKLTPRIDQRFQGVSQAEGQKKGQRRKNLIFNLVQFALDYPNKEKLTEKLQNNNKRGVQAPERKCERNH